MYTLIEKNPIKNELDNDTLVSNFIKKYAIKRDNPGTLSFIDRVFPKDFINKLCVFLNKTNTKHGVDTIEADEGRIRIKNLINELRIVRAKLSSNDLEALSKLETISLLEILDSDIGDEGAKLLAKSETIPALKIMANNIGDEGAKALAANKSIISLNLNKNKITNEGFQELAKNKTLRELRIRANNINDSALKSLEDNETLELLDLAYNQIGDEGAITLSRSHIKSLNLEGNDITDVGAMAFAEATPTTLNLRNTLISSNEVVERLRKNTSIKELNILVGNRTSSVYLY